MDTFFTPDAVKNMSNQQIADALEGRFEAPSAYVIAELFRRLDDLTKWTAGKVDREDLIACRERINIASPYPE